MLAASFVLGCHGPVVSGLLGLHVNLSRHVSQRVGQRVSEVNLDIRIIHARMLFEKLCLPGYCIRRAMPDDRKVDHQFGQESRSPQVVSADVLDVNSSRAPVDN